MGEKGKKVPVAPLALLSSYRSFNSFHFGGISGRKHTIITVHPSGYHIYIIHPHLLLNTVQDGIALRSSSRCIAILYVRMLVRGLDLALYFRVIYLTPTCSRTSLFSCSLNKTLQRKFHQAIAGWLSFFFLPPSLCLQYSLYLTTTNKSLANNGINYCLSSQPTESP